MQKLTVNREPRGSDETSHAVPGGCEQADVNINYKHIASDVCGLHFIMCM